jgi:hypothetical protein
MQGKVRSEIFKIVYQKVIKGNMCCDGTASIPSALQIGLCDILNVAIVQSLTVQLKSLLLSVELPKS